MSGTMVSADHHRELIDAKDARIKELETEIVKFHRMVEDEARDCSLILNMVQYFVVRAIERGDYQQIRDAIRAAINDTGLSGDTVAEMVERLGICSRDMVMSGYNVTLTVPVNVTIYVEAVDDEAAEEEAQEQLGMNGIDSYSSDWDSYNIEVLTVEETY